MAGKKKKRAVLDCCDCEATCCPNRGDWPASLVFEMTDTSPEGCFSVSGTLAVLDDTLHTYGGTITGSCSWCSQTFDIRFSVIVTCSSQGGWSIQFGPELGDECGQAPPSDTLDQIACDPILLTGDIDCFSCGLMNCEVPGDPPLPYPHPPFCPSVMVYELLA